MLNYLDIFEQFDKKINKNSETTSSKVLDNSKITIRNHNDSKLLSQYFKLDYTYLSFMDSNDASGDVGANDDHIYLLKTNTGKTKVKTSEFIKYLNLFNPEIAHLPFEYLTEECGKKRVMRCYKKMKEFMKTFNSTDVVANHNIKFIVPMFLSHLDLLPTEEIFDMITTNEKFITGYLIIIENYKKINFEKIFKYKNFIESNLNSTMLVKFGQGHPIDLMISYEIGCRLFEVSLPFDLSDTGKCILSNFYDNFKDFEFNIKESQNLKSLENIDFSQYDLNLIDLNEIKYESDTHVIKENCQCFTCKGNYTRAYIHHLLKCHELNANILITLHNLHFIEKLYHSYSSLHSQSDRINYLLKFLKEECCKV